MHQINYEITPMKKKKVNLRDIDTEKHAGEHTHDGGHNHSSPESISKFKKYVPAIFSFTLLIVGIALDYFKVAIFKELTRVIWYVVAFFNF